MKFARLTSTLAAVLLTAMTARGQLVNYEMVTVGDAGNAADTTGYGAVPYDYRIGKYEVTIGQWAAFLNAVAKADTYSLYDTRMTSDRNGAGISRSGASGSYEYSVIGPFGITPVGASSPDNRPITYITWFDAARFANWMSNGQPTGMQTGTTTENGAYALNGTMGGTAPAMNDANPNTDSIPLFRIPTEDEWYKAAYSKGGSDSAGYWTFATQSNVAPGNTISGAANQANYLLPGGVYSVTQSSSFNFPNQNFLTNVGAFTGNPSAYGTFDQSGNVYEWNDLDGAAGSGRGLRGGSWYFGRLDLLSSKRLVFDASSVLIDGGFRLASPVPEPSTYAMALAGLACGGFSMWRRRKRA